MSALPKWLGTWIARLLPKQKSKGDNAVQFGKVGGNVTIVHLTQHLPCAPPVQPVAVAPVIDPALHPFRPGRVATDEQRQVLQIMRRLPNKTSLEEFMQREFGTLMVIDLQPSQLFRVRRYAEAIYNASLVGAKSR